MFILGARVLVTPICQMLYNEATVIHTRSLTPKLFWYWRVWTKQISVVWPSVNGTRYLVRICVYMCWTRIFGQFTARLGDTSEKCRRECYQFRSSIFSDRDFVGNDKSLSSSISLAKKTYEEKFDKPTCLPKKDKQMLVGLCRFLCGTPEYVNWSVSS